MFINTEILRTYSIWHLTGPPTRRPSFPNVPDFPLKHNENVKIFQNIRLILIHIIAFIIVSNYSRMAGLRDAL